MRVTLGLVLMRKMAELGLVVNMKVVGMEIRFPKTYVRPPTDFYIKNYADSTN